MFLLGISFGYQFSCSPMVGSLFLIALVTHWNDIVCLVATADDMSAIGRRLRAIAYGTGPSFVSGLIFPIF